MCHVSTRARSGRLEVRGGEAWKSKETKHNMLRSHRRARKACMACIECMVRLASLWYKLVSKCHLMKHTRHNVNGDGHDHVTGVPDCVWRCANCAICAAMGVGGRANCDDRA